MARAMDRDREILDLDAHHRVEPATPVGSTSTTRPADRQ